MHAHMYSIRGPVHESHNGSVATDLETRVQMYYTCGCELAEGVANLLAHA